MIQHSYAAGADAGCYLLPCAAHQLTPPGAQFRAPDSSPPMPPSDRVSVLLKRSRMGLCQPLGSAKCVQVYE